MGLNKIIKKLIFTTEDAYACWSQLLVRCTFYSFPKYMLPKSRINEVKAENWICKDWKPMKCEPKYMQQRSSHFYRKLEYSIVGSNDWEDMKKKLEKWTAYMYIGKKWKNVSPPGHCFHDSVGIITYMLALKGLNHCWLCQRSLLTASSVTTNNRMLYSN